MKYRIGIDATSIVNYGGLTHLIEILRNYESKKHPFIKDITIYSSNKVLNKLPNKKFFNKKTFGMLNKSRISRILFQKFFFDSQLRENIDILLSLTGDYTGKFSPYVGISQNMLLYKRDLWNLIFDPIERFKLYFNYRRQKTCFENSSGVIFLSKYAQQYVKSCLSISSIYTEIINHGVSNHFKNNDILKEDFKCINEYSYENPFKFLYVSSVHVYKNHSNVINAISRVREMGYPISLTIIGQIIYNPSGKKMLSLIERVDSKK